MRRARVYVYTWKDNRLSDCQPVCLAGHTFTGQTNRRERRMWRSIGGW